MERRELLKFGAILGFVGVPNIVTASPVIPGHPIFATTLHDGMLEKLLWMRHPVIPYTIEDGAAEKTKAESGLDLVAEVKSAVRQHTINLIEQAYVTKLRDREPVAIFDMLNMTGTPTFVGDVHAHFGDMIVAANPDANTVIVSPTGLTILQSSTSSLFRRVEAPKPFPFGLFKVGTLDDRMDVIVDQYCRDAGHTLVGHVAEADQDRKLAMIEIDNGVAVGASPDFEKGWVTVGLDVSNMTFL